MYPSFKKNCGQIDDLEKMFSFDDKNMDFLF